MSHRRKHDHKPRHHTHAVKPANLTKPVPATVVPEAFATSPQLQKHEETGEVVVTESAGD